jgi:hypothetical protein
MAQQPNKSGGDVSAPYRAPAAKVLAGALANNKVAQSLISALGLYSLNAILATSTSQTLNFGSLQAGDFVIHMPGAPSLPPGSPNLASASTYGILAKSAITTVNPSIVNGDFGISPNNGSSVTGAFTVSGATHEGDTAAATAQSDANAAYVALAAHAGYTTIPNALDAQSLTAGYYTFASGDVNLATSADGTLTLTGSATDIFVFKTPSTLHTGAGGMPTITLVGVLASNVYWVIGSSATLNVGVTSAGGVFPGTVLAAVSITVTQSGTINGRLLATTASGAAISLSDHATINAGPGSPMISYSTIAAAGNLGFPAVIGDLYLDLALVDLDRNNPIIPPPPAGNTARQTGDGGLDF